MQKTQRYILQFWSCSKYTKNWGFPEEEGVIFASRYDFKYIGLPYVLLLEDMSSFLEKYSGVFKTENHDYAANSGL